MSSEAVKTVVESAPAATAAVSIIIFGITLNEWVAILSICVLVQQLAYGFWRWHVNRKRSREGQEPLKVVE